MTDSTHDNATPGLVARMGRAALWCADNNHAFAMKALDDGMAAITALQAALEVETARADKAEADVVQLQASHLDAVQQYARVLDERNASLSRVTEAKAEGWDEGRNAAFGAMSGWGKIGFSPTKKIAALINPHLAQSGGADPAQGGDVATTALAYLVNAQHDLRMGSDPVRAAATLSEGVAAVEAGMRASHG